MKAVILVGGEGTRLRPLTYTICKSMVPVVGKPFLEHVLLWLRENGVSEVILTLHYLPEKIREYFGGGEGMGIKLRYVMERERLGTAGAVKNAEEFLDETFFVLNGDIFMRMDLGEMLSYHRKKGSKVTIALTPVENPQAFGLVNTDEEGRIISFVEKPKPEEIKTNLINAGIYILEPEILSYMEKGKRLMFETDIFPKLISKEPIYAFPSRGYWIDIGRPENYLKLNLDLLEGKVLKGEGTVVEGDAGGPLIAGRDCVIKRGARLERVLLWDRVFIEEGAHIEDSILASGVRVGKGARLREVVAGEGAVIGDGASLSGERIDPGKVIG